MSLIRKFLNIWGSGGTLESPAPDADKIDLGYVGDERPYIDRLNWLHNRSEKKIDDLAVQGVSSAYDEATEATVQGMIETGLWGSSWGCTDDTANVIAGGALKAYKDITTYFNSDGDARLLVADSAAMTIEVWDPRDRTLQDTSGDLCDDLPVAVVAATTFIKSIFTDGTWVYVVFRDAATAPDEYYIQAWRISDWSVKGTWPATGTLLTPTGNIKQFKGIIASATRIAVVNDATTITAAGDPAIEIVNISTGAIVADGAGDAMAVAGNKTADPCLASDGTNVFFCAVDAGGELYHCSATIANPAVGCGGTDWGQGSGYSANAGAMVSMGEKIVTFIYPTTPLESLYAIMTHTAVDATMDRIKYGQNDLAAPLVGSEYVYNRPMDALFDGMNVWVYVNIDNLSAGTHGGILKIDAAKLSFNPAIDEHRCINDLEPSLFLVMPGDAVTLALPQMGMTFDGRDIWTITAQIASTTNSGNIARLPLALVRS